MKLLLAGCLVVFAAVCGETASAGDYYYGGVTRTYTDHYGNPISKAEYDRQLADYNRKVALPSSRVDSSGTVWYYSSELNGGSRYNSGGSSYSTRSNYGTSYSTTNNYGDSYNTTNNYGRSYGTINNYGDSNLTINNYGNGRTTVNDFGSSRTTVNRRGRR